MPDLIAFVRLVGICAAVAAVGMAAAVYGRLALHKHGDTYRGSALAWACYLGGIQLTAVAAGGVIFGLVWTVTR